MKTWDRHNDSLCQQGVCPSQTDPNIRSGGYSVLPNSAAALKRLAAAPGIIRRHSRHPTRIQTRCRIKPCWCISVSSSFLTRHVPSKWPSKKPDVERHRGRDGRNRRCVANLFFGGFVKLLRSCKRQTWKCWDFQIQASFWLSR